MTWEPDSIYTTELHAGDDDQADGDYAVKKRLSHFLRTFTLEKVSIYRDQLVQCVHDPNPYIEVNLDHLSAYNDELGHLVFDDPVRCLGLLESAAYDFAKDLIGEENCPPIQVLVTTSTTPMKIRDINSSFISKLVVVPGLVIGTSPVTPRATQITAVCTSCKHQLTIRCNSDGFTLPRKCQRQSESAGGPASAGGACPLDPYVVVPDFSKFADFQFLKIQEAPEDVPPGEMPRPISATVDRALANASIPGSRNLFVAIYEMHQYKGNTQRPLLRVVGLMSPQKQAEVADSRPPTNVFKTRKDIVEALAPEIYGMDDVKLAIACQLFAGVQKVLPDKSRRRGDINVLLFGDPSVGKSQLLKFAHRVAPIGVYTSGKGSSAAGLTASVIRHSSTGEFILEGGAMVLADGGIVCIDEFDKMRNTDRVAIHEAMEQQTISIAKAGITAVLNTRTAVLAAANPVMGRFDDLKSARDNIDFQTTILSRFDLIFVLKDVRDEERDSKTVEHVMKVHKTADDTNSNQPTINELKSYITYARRKCRPVISEGAINLLKNEYVKMRSSVDNRESIPITVRQLEALVRISEALAKMELSDECKEEHVKEAIRLFKVSTFDAANRGVIAPEGAVTEEQRKEAERIEAYINRRCPIGSKIPEAALLNELQKIFSDFCIIRVLQTMLYTGQFEQINHRKVLKRVQTKDVD
ncbi:MCM2/3/5 family protein [Tritrichomonas foetus]|uniref:DNA replication licensing factor MCM5 n=1 Tax=Tritrichomonas foetus TaxID=1144522 RepID=A0A1J4J623_9EUKA|nr:MCM2/3/5 family protein [Tritrichomonas foetus]|eukprot:OHS93607.1 MCM2/3/5 family protein [Tritrichomonas foetus]